MDRYSLRDEINDSIQYYKDLGIEPGALYKKRDEIVRNKISDAIGAIVELTNSTANSSEDMAEGIFDGIRRSHPHLQGEFWIVMEKAIRKYSEMKAVDGRNSFARDMCEAFIKGNDERIS